MNKYLPYLFTFVISFLHADDQVFFPDRQKTLLSFQYTHYQTDHFWNEDGKRLSTFNDFNHNRYEGLGQYILNPQNAFFIQGGYGWVEEELNGRTLGLEDALIGWRYTFSSTPWSAQLIAIVPLGSHKSSLRYGSYGGEIAVFYSEVITLFKERGFIDTKVAYRRYTDFPSDQLRGHVHVGWWPYDSFYLLAGAYLIYGLNNAEKQFTENFIVFHSNVKLAKTVIMASYTFFSRLNLALGYEQHMWGRNVGCGRELFAQLSYYF